MLKILEFFFKKDKREFGQENDFVIPYTSLTDEQLREDDFDVRNLLDEVTAIHPFCDNGKGEIRFEGQLSEKPGFNISCGRCNGHAIFLGSTSEDFAKLVKILSSGEERVVDTKRGGKVRFIPKE